MARSIVVLHGHASSATAASRLGRALAPDATIVAPEGPDPVAGNRLARSWFDPGTLTGLARSATLLRGIAIDLAAAGDAPLVVGFSQGAATAIAAFGPTGSPPVAGVVLWAGFAVEPPSGELSFDGFKGVDLLSVHSADDEVVPVWMADDVAALAAAAGAEVTVARLSGGHDRTPEAMELVGEWLRARCG